MFSEKVAILVGMELFVDMLFGSLLHVCVCGGGGGGGVVIWI